LAALGDYARIGARVGEAVKHASSHLTTPARRKQGAAVSGMNIGLGRSNDAFQADVATDISHEGEPALNNLERGVIDG
jgi:hypothetical protein